MGDEDARRTAFYPGERSAKIGRRAYLPVLVGYLSWNKEKAMSDKFVIRSLEDLDRQRAAQLGRRMSLAEYGARLDGDIKDAEIEKLRAELDNAQHHIEMLQAKLDAEKSCACAYDDPNEVCLPHSPLLEKARAELDMTREQLNAAVALIAWDYWNGGASEWSHSGGDNHYKEARWGKGILRSLIDAEIAKLEGESNA